MRNRLTELLAELEDINHNIQQGCVDRSHLSCFRDGIDFDIAMSETDRLAQAAHSKIETLLTMMKEQGE